MGSTPGATKLGLVGGATKTDVSSCLLDVATTEVSATPGSVDSAFGLETSGLADAQAGSDASWDPTATGSTLRPESWVSG